MTYCEYLLCMIHIYDIMTFKKSALWPLISYMLPKMCMVSCSILHIPELQSETFLAWGTRLSFCSQVKLIHEADPQSRPVMIIVIAHVRPSVYPSPLFKTKQISSESNDATGETVGLAEWIMDNTCLVRLMFFHLKTMIKSRLCSGKYDMIFI